MHTALLLIDIQNDFMPTGSLPVAGGDQIVPVANRLAQRFDVVVASQDWHPAGHSSFANSHPDRQAFDVTTVDGLGLRFMRRWTCSRSRM